MPLSIDTLPTQKSLLDLSALPKYSLDSALYGFQLEALLDDVILVRYVDETPDGTTIKRGSLYVPVNADTKAWRTGQVILAGPNVKLATIGKFVIFPNHVGIPIANIKVAAVEGPFDLKAGIFLNEQRIFGIAEVDQTNHESVARHLTNNPAK